MEAVDKLFAVALAPVWMVQLVQSNKYCTDAMFVKLDLLVVTEG